MYGTNPEDASTGTIHACLLGVIVIYVYLRCLIDFASGVESTLPQFLKRRPQLSITENDKIFINKWFYMVHYRTK